MYKLQPRWVYEGGTRGTGGSTPKHLNQPGRLRKVSGGNHTGAEIRGRSGVRRGRTRWPSHRKRQCRDLTNAEAGKRAGQCSWEAAGVARRGLEGRPQGLGPRAPRSTAQAGTEGPSNKPLLRTKATFWGAWWGRRERRKLRDAFGPTGRAGLNQRSHGLRVLPQCPSLNRGFTTHGEKAVAQNIGKLTVNLCYIRMSFWWLKSWRNSHGSSWLKSVTAIWDATAYTNPGPPSNITSLIPSSNLFEEFLDKMGESERLSQGHANKQMEKANVGPAWHVSKSWAVSAPQVDPLTGHPGQRMPPTFQLRDEEPSPSPAWRWWAFPTLFLCHLGDNLEGVWCVQTLSKSRENSTKRWCEAKTLKITLLKSRQTFNKGYIWYHIISLTDGL